MTQTYTEDVLIDGSQDTEQLRVQGHSTQTTPLQVWEDSSGDELAQVTGDGRLQVGSFTGSAMDTADSLIEVHRDEADTAKPKRGLHLLGEMTGTLSEIVWWAVQELVLKGTGSISAIHSALRVKLQNENTGTMTTGAKLRAGDFEAINEGGSQGNAVPEMVGVRAAVTNQSNGYLGSAVGVDVELEQATGGDGEVDTAYGIRVDNVDQGTSNNYAIQTGAGLVKLGDVVELAEQMSAVPTPATGLMRLYPKDDGKLYAQNDSGQEFDLTSGELEDEAVTTAKLADDAVTTTKLADNAVTAEKLADTSVIAGPYTSADITVDAQGRITAASNGGASAPFNHRRGLTLRKLTDDHILVDMGSVMVEDTLIEKMSGTVLDLYTDPNWIGGMSTEDDEMWINVYVDASGNLKLHDKLPHYPRADTSSRVATMQVNQFDWMGMDESGLNATSVVYDNDTGAANVEAGMYLGVYGDASYTEGRGKGSGASVSVANLSFARITAIDTNTNTLTLEAGHQIGIWDDDYLIVIESGTPLYRQESGTWYRWLGAIYNDSSGNLVSSGVHSESYFQADENTSNYTRASMAWADVDSDKFAHNLITTAPRVQIGFSGTVIKNTSATATGTVGFDVMVDGDWLGSTITQDYGLIHTTASNGEVQTMSFVVMAELPIGTHAFKLKWGTSSSSVSYTLQSSISAAQFWVRELPHAGT